MISIFYWTNLVVNSQGDSRVILGVDFMSVMSVGLSEIPQSYYKFASMLCVMRIATWKWYWGTSVEDMKKLIVGDKSGA